MSNAPAAAVPAGRVAARMLELANPFMQGADVRRLQELLNRNPYGTFACGVDGEYGRQTAGAVKRAKWELGYPKAKCNNEAGPTLVAYLGGSQKLPAAFAARRRLRTRQLANAGSVRQRIVAAARWGIENEPNIHYRQSRPIDGNRAKFKLPLYTDCSGFVTNCYEWAGGPDPNGLKFCGKGYTGTLLDACRRIPKSAVQPGDLVVFGAPPGNHVSLVLEAGDDPLLVSHGQERGPVEIRFSAQARFQAEPAVWLTCLS